VRENIAYARCAKANISLSPKFHEKTTTIVDLAAKLDLGH